MRARADADSRSDRVAGVLLAAGESTRMGQPKALLPWGPEGDPDAPPLLIHQLRGLQAAGVTQPVVVLGYQADRLRAVLTTHECLASVNVVENTAYRTGRASSVIAGVTATAPGHHVLILNVDQPRSARLLCHLIIAPLGATAAITVPQYEGRRGHPPIFAPQLRAELLAVEEASQGLRAVVERHRSEVHAASCAEPAVLTNLNTPADYREARRAWFSSSLPSA